MSLFDDPDEIEAAERRELKYHQAQILRLQRQDKSNRVRKEKAASRIAQGKSPEPWYSRIFRRGEDQRTGALDDQKPDVSPRESTEYEYVIVRRPSTPEVIYTLNDVDPVDSPWLAECGMVRVRSDDEGGCHIVPKSSIQTSGKREQ